MATNKDVQRWIKRRYGISVRTTRINSFQGEQPRIRACGRHDDGGVRKRKLASRPYRNRLIESALEHFNLMNHKTGGQI